MCFGCVLLSLNHAPKWAPSWAWVLQQDGFSLYEPSWNFSWSFPSLLLSPNCSQRTSVPWRYSHRQLLGHLSVCQRNQSVCYLLLRLSVCGTWLLSSHGIASVPWAEVLVSLPSRTPQVFRLMNLFPWRLIPTRSVLGMLSLAELHHRTLSKLHEGSVPTKINQTQILLFFFLFLFLQLFPVRKGEMHDVSQGCWCLEAPSFSPRRPGALSTGAWCMGPAHSFAGLWQTGSLLL